MSSVDALLRELEETLINGSKADRSAILQRITDLFVSTSTGLQDDQIGFFDVVISRVSRDIERAARIELAERLAPVPNAPTGVIKQLAMDEIAVAKPVISTSQRLTNNDLLKIGKAKGEQHMLAMTGRSDLGENLSDYLVLKGGQVVTRALVANKAAKLSRQAMGVLVMRAVTDHDLQSALSGRQDLPKELAGQIIHLATLSAQKRLKAGLEPSAALAEDIDQAVEAGARNVAATTQFSVGVTTLDPDQEAIQALVDAGKLNEASVRDFAASGQRDRAVRALAALASISYATAEQVVFGDQRDSLLLVTKALGWSWETTASMIGLRAMGNSEIALQRSKRQFEKIDARSSNGVLMFLRSN